MGAIRSKWRSGWKTFSNFLGTRDDAERNLAAWLRALIRVLL